MTDPLLVQAAEYGVPVTLAVRRPTRAELLRSSVVFERALEAARRAGAPSDAEAYRQAREAGLWSADLDAKLAYGVGLLDAAGARLAAGDMPPDERAGLVESMKVARDELRRMVAGLAEFACRSAEGLAIQEECERLVVLCSTYPDTGRPVFSDLADFRRRAGDPVGLRAAEAMAALLAYCLEDDGLPRLGLAPVRFVPHLMVAKMPV